MLKDYKGGRQFKAAYNFDCRIDNIGNDSLFSCLQPVDIQEEASRCCINTVWLCPEFFIHLCHSGQAVYDLHVGDIGARPDSKLNLKRKLPSLCLYIGNALLRDNLRARIMADKECARNDEQYKDEWECVIGCCYQRP